MRRAFAFVFLLLLVGAVVAKVVLFDFPKISGNDMAPAVQRGDWLLVFKGNTVPRRGQLVLMEHPMKNTVMVRRVVGLPGEKVMVRKETPIIDGKPARRRVLRDIALKESVDGQPEASRMKLVEEQIGDLRYELLKDPGRRSVDTKPLRLGPGQYFVMADHRNHGTDSRTFGPVSAERIKGVVSRRLIAGDGCVGGPRESFESFAE